ncbi:hypothetical protein Bca101_059413 [Brassica carinata]
MASLPSRLVQLAKLASWSCSLVQLAKMASWPYCLIQLVILASPGYGILIRSMPIPWSVSQAGVVPNGLAAIWSFCRVPELVEFCLREAGETAESPPEGYFTCFEAHLMQCYLWFPILAVIAKLLNGFRLSIRQIYPCGLNHIVGILVLSYKLGVTLNVSHFESLLKPCGKFDHGSAKTSNEHGDHKGILLELPSLNRLFFLCSSHDVSVEASGIPFLHPHGVRKKCLWASFTPKRVRHAVALHRSRLEPDLQAGEESGSGMDGFVPCKDQKKKRKSEKCKGKNITVDNVAAVGQDFPDDLIRDYLKSGKPVDLDEFFDFDPPADDGSNEVQEFAEASRMIKRALLSVSQALSVSRQEACMAQFKAEMADKEIARLKGELERSHCRGREPSEAEIRRAYRRGKNEVAEIVRARRERFSHEFGELQASHKSLGEYRECRGTAGSCNSPTGLVGGVPTRQVGEFVLFLVQLTNLASWKSSNSPGWRVGLASSPIRQSGELEVLQLAVIASWSCFESNSPIGRVALVLGPTRQSGKLEVLQLAGMASWPCLESNSPIVRVGGALTRREGEFLSSWVEFEIPSVDPEDAAAYWEACGGLKPPEPGYGLPVRLYPTMRRIARARAVPMNAFAMELIRFENEMIVCI